MFVRNYMFVFAKLFSQQKLFELLANHLLITTVSHIKLKHFKSVWMKASVKCLKH